MPRTRSKVEEVQENDSGGDSDEISLTSWLDLYHGFISDTADILKDEINNVRKVKVLRNEATLKNEKKPEAVRLMKNIVTSFHDSIAKAVKDLQNHGTVMSEELQKRFNLPEDWMQSSSTTVSVAGSEINGPTLRHLHSKSSDTDSDASGATSIVPSTKNISPTKALGASAVKKERKSEAVRSPRPTFTETTVDRPEDVAVTPRKSISKVVNPKKEPGDDDSDVDMDNTIMNKSDVDEEQQQEPQIGDLNLSTANSKDASDEDIMNFLSPPPACPLPDLSVDLDETNTVILSGNFASAKSTTNGNGEENPEVSEETALPEDKAKESDVTDPIVLTNSKERKQERKQHPQNSTKKSKEERDAMKDVLGSMSSDSESSSNKKKENKSPCKRETKVKSGSSKHDVESSSGQNAEMSWRDDPKLKESSRVEVLLEKLPPSIEKKLAEEKYVVLKGFNKMKKCTLTTLIKSIKNGSSESDSSTTSNDSLVELEKQLKKLTKNSIIRTMKYQKKRKDSETAPRTKLHKTRRSARKTEEDELVSSDSDASHGEGSKNIELKKITKAELSSDIASCSGSEDIDPDSDESTTRNKRTTRTISSTNHDKKRKTYEQATITSSDSDSEKRNMKEILGSDSESDSKKKTRSRKPKASSGSDSDFINPTKKASKKNLKQEGSDSDTSLLSIKSDDSESDSDSDFKKSRKSSKRSRDSSSDTKQRKKKRRKRIVTNDSDDSEQKGSDDSDIEEIEQDDQEASSSQKGRKNIRKIMSTKALAKSTKEAEKEEEERRKRLTEKQKLFNGIHKAPESDKLERLILDVDPETKDPVIEVDKSIVKQLKPHQAEGIKFMYNACFESVDLIKQGKVPGGCILAHCMGLGKTLQSIAFIHTLLTNKLCEIKTALVICPLSTVNNWFNEFRSWTDEADQQLKIHKLYDAKNTVASRIDYLKTWHRRGGVGILHYDMFRRLADPKGKSKMKSNLKQVINETLLDPGPDIVICDEGHLLKNCKSMLSLAVSNIRTHRRIVLTGTPLQNNLVEYHTMMNFVKPNLLGSLPEFTNRFVNPIKNGQHADSTEYDVKTMKRRAHVLHRKLEGCVQRCDYSILAPYLPPKYEYIIKIKLSDKQEELYKHYLESVVDSDPLTRRRNLLKYYAELVKVWSHPIALTMRRPNKDDEESTSEEGSLKDFIDDGSSPASESEGGSSDSRKNGGSNTKRKTRAQAVNDPEPDNANLNIESVMQGSGWWNAVCKSKSEMQDCSLSGKLVILQEILKTSEGIGDKVLVFSQYLSSLDIIEEFLQDWDQQAEREEKEKDEPITFPLTSGPKLGRWRRNIEYFRIDGTTKVQDRHRDCEKFNKKSSLSRAKLFLISTRAGGLGINLYGANRVVIFDASWNPSQDMQSIFRVYRFGQDKPCYIYRLIARGTMEEKILRRQITKLSLSSRVVDEHQIERHFKFDDVNEMYVYDDEDPSAKDVVLAVPKDRLLADLLMSHRDWIRGYEEFDSLLENKPDEGLSNDEKELAWEEYRIESERQRQFSTSNSSAVNEAATYLKVKSRLSANHPHATVEQLDQATRVSLDVIEKIRRLMLLQNSGGNVDHLLTPLKIWLQRAVTPHEPSSGVAPELSILGPLPPEYYEPHLMAPIPQQQYINRPPIPRRYPHFNAQAQGPPPQFVQNMSHNFRHIASNTLGTGGFNRAYQQQQ